MPEFIHNYRIVHDKDSNKVIEGLHFTFIELPKFSPHSVAEKRMAVLWLRFLTEIGGDTSAAPAELLDDPSISKALEEVRISAFTDNELLAYDKFWDGVRVEKTLQYDSFQNGLEEGIQKGLEEGVRKGLEEGIQKGIEQRNLEIARKMLASGMDVNTIVEMTGLSKEDIL